MSNSTPPGWYPVQGADGTAGHERWWDGSAWTSDVRPVQAGGGGLADAPTQVSWQSNQPAAPATPPSYGYGAPQQGTPSYGYPAQGQASYGYPPAAGYPPPTPSGRMKPGVAVAIVVGVLAVVGVVAAIALNSGHDTPRADPTPTVTVTTDSSPTPSPSPTKKTSPPPTPTPTPSLPPVPVVKDTAADAQHSITVPVFQGWDAQTDTTHSTVFLGSGRYTCPGGGSCIRGQFSVEKDTISGSSARAAAEAAMPAYAGAIFTGVTGHTDAGSSSTTVAGISGYAVRWHITTSDGTKGYVLMVAVPAKGGGYVAFEGGVDDAAGAPDPSVLDQILKGIKQDTSASGSGT